LIAAPILLSQDASLDSLKEAGQWRQFRTRVEGWYRTKLQDPYAQLWISRVKQAFNDAEWDLDLARKAATRAPAEAFRLADRGRITPGARADVVLVDGNPLADIKATRAIVRVFKNGYDVRRTPSETAQPQPR